MDALTNAFTTAIDFLNAIPAETWTVLLGVLAAALGGRYAWIVRAAQAIVTAAQAQHPDDHSQQLEHVQRKHGSKLAAKRAAKIIRARMEAQRPTPVPALVDRDGDDATRGEA